MGIEEKQDLDPTGPGHEKEDVPALGENQDLDPTGPGQEQEDVLGLGGNQDLDATGQGQEQEDVLGLGVYGSESDEEDGEVPQPEGQHLEDSPDLELRDRTELQNLPL